jgi:hypothetical protein
MTLLIKVISKFALAHKEIDEMSASNQKLCGCDLQTASSVFYRGWNSMLTEKAKYSHWMSFVSVSTSER